MLQGRQKAKVRIREHAQAHVIEKGSRRINIKSTFLSPFFRSGFPVEIDSNSWLPPSFTLQGSSFGLYALFIFCTVSLSSLAAAGGQNENHWPGAELFTISPPRCIRIHLASTEMETLRHEPREFVRATILEGKTVFSDVAVHLKGSVGSFQQ